MSKKRRFTDAENLLLFQAFLLDTQIDTPESCLIVDKGRNVLLSEVFAQQPQLLRDLIIQRAEVYRQLGLAVPHE